MHQRGYTNDELGVWADIMVAVDIQGQIETTGHLVIAGHHPTLGNVVSIQDREGVILHSERPPAVQ